MTHLGAGWRIHHLTDRVIELRKDDVAYRKYTGRDGYVRVRAEPGMDRAEIIEKAKQLAIRNDAELAIRMVKDIVPRRLGGYQMQQRQMAHAFGTSEDLELIGVKSA